MENVQMFAGDVALISGANKGIGFETARGLGARGITVLVGARDQWRGQTAVEKLRAEGADARFVRLDVTDPATIARAAEWIGQEFGRLDILINNAGMGEWNAKPSSVDMAKVREVYETNFFGPVAMIQTMLPLLGKSKHGRIVNVTSTLGSLAIASDPNAGLGDFLALAYCSSKSALNSMTIQFAKELRDTPIKVNAVCPGYCATDLNNHSGPRTAAQGAVAPIQYATLGEDGPTGGYFNEQGPIRW